MYNFWALAGFEYKKLLKRKIVWITLAILTGISIFTACSSLIGNYYVEGVLTYTHYAIVKKDIVQSKEITGSQIDDTLFTMFRETGRRIPNGLHNLLRSLYGNYELEQLNEETMYTARDQQMRQVWADAGLTVGEKEYLSALEEEIETPFVYRYAGGYERILALMYSQGIMLLLFISICVPNIFTEEHSQKTDQLILSSTLGKRPLYLAKLFVGVSFSMAGAVILSLAVMIPVFVIYGIDGYTAGIQTLLPMLSWDMSVGTAVLILTGLMLIAAVLFSVITMVVSEKCRNGSSAVVVMIGIILFSMFFSAPPQYRVLSQIWECMPMALISVNNALDIRMIPFLGTYLTTWEAVPFLYLIAAAVFALVGYRVYSRFQVGGR